MMPVDNLTRERLRLNASCMQYNSLSTIECEIECEIMNILVGGDFIKRVWKPQFIAERQN